MCIASIYSVNDYCAPLLGGFRGGAWRQGMVAAKTSLVSVKLWCEFTAFSACGEPFDDHERAFGIGT